MDAKKISYFTIDDIYALPEGKRAELIGGQIYNMAPPNRIHQEILNAINYAINHYIKTKGGSCKVYPAPFAVFLNKDDSVYVEPDISVICDINKLDNRGCSGSPDWIVEIISPGTASHDYIRKLNLYKESGVREYWIVDSKAEKIMVYFFESDWIVKTFTFEDKIKVNIYSDFEIDFRSMDF